MPLILAVEPDRKQAEAVAALARGVLRSEVIVTDSADAALAVMASRIPDLLLTSLLLPPKDEAKIADRLRSLDASGTYVQTLVIPMLASSGKRSPESKRNINRLWKSKTKASAPDGCAPEVFASQISEYLRRAATKGAQTPGSATVRAHGLDEPVRIPEEPVRANDSASPLRDPAIQSGAPSPGTSFRAESILLPPSDLALNDDHPIEHPIELTGAERLGGEPPRTEPLIAKPLIPTPAQAPPTQSSPAQASHIQATPAQERLVRTPPPSVAPRSEPEAGTEKRARTASKPAQHLPQKAAPAGPPPRGAGQFGSSAAGPSPQAATVRPAPSTSAVRSAPRAPVRPTPGVAARPSPTPPGAAINHVGAAPTPPKGPSPHSVPAGSFLKPSPAAPGPSAPPAAVPSSTGTATVSERLRRLAAEPPPAPHVALPVPTQPSAPSVEHAPSADAGQSDESTARPMMVLGALDLGAFVEQLAAAKEQPALPEAEPVLTTPMRDAAAAPEPFFAAAQTAPAEETVQTDAVQHAAVQTGVQASAVQTAAAQTGTVQSAPAQTAAVQPATVQAAVQPVAGQTAAEQSRRDRAQKPRRAVQDEWGIFDPQQAGFAALFAKLEEITEQDEVPAEPPA